MPEISPPRAILVDLDDTILDDHGGVHVAWQETCEAFAQRLNGLGVEPFLQAVHRVAAWYWSDPERHRVGRQDLRGTTAWIVGEALRSLGREDDALARAIAHAYRDRRDALVRPFPGAVDALATLKARGLLLALVTNGAASAQRAKIERFDLARYFDFILVEGEFGAGKPEERVYRAAMEALGSSPDETWMVGDNLEWEVAVPQRLGLTTVWVDHARRGLPPNPPARPHHVVHALADLPGLVPSRSPAPRDRAR